MTNANAEVSAERASPCGGVSPDIINTLWHTMCPSRDTERMKEEVCVRVCVCWRGWGGGDCMNGQHRARVTSCRACPHGPGVNVKLLNEWRHNGGWNSWDDGESCGCDALGSSRQRLSGRPTNDHPEDTDLPGPVWRTSACPRTKVPRGYLKKGACLLAIRHDDTVLVGSVKTVHAYKEPN